MTPRASRLRSVKQAAGKPEPAENIRLTADRILVRVPDSSERRSKTGLLIPATATTPLKRCVWSEVILVGPETRNVRVGDDVLFIPQSGLEVDVRGEIFLLLRERDVQAVSSERSDPQSGQYL
jgi:chaperonin GroES